MVDKRSERLAIAALFVAWIGIWGAWIPTEAVALRQNALDLAEWATFLPEVRGGALRLIPELLRLSVALITIASAWKSARIGNGWLRWAVRLICLIPGFLLLPPYPFVLQLWNSESYGLRFIIAGFSLLGVGFSLFSGNLPERVLRGMGIVLLLVGIGTSYYGYLALRGPLAIRLGMQVHPGWGVVVFLGGSIVSLLLEGRTIVLGRVPVDRLMKTKTGQTS